jgi:CubicO group peptidase (beta-lactamase class C family)
MRKLILVILSIFSTAIPLRAGADTGCQASESEIQNAVGEVHTKQSNVGLAAAIVRGEHILFSEYLGLADVEFGIDVDRNTRFGAASITKLYTAVTLLQHPRARSPWRCSQNIPPASRIHSP